MQRPTNHRARRRPAHHQPVPPRAPRRPARRKRRFHTSRLVLLGAALSLLLVGACFLTLAVGVGLVYGSGNVIPGVHAAGVDVSGMSQSEAAVALSQTWNEQGLVLRDGARTWTAAPAELGITLDAGATAAHAYEWGRSKGGFSGILRSLTGQVDIAPVLNVDLAQLTAYLESAKPSIDLPATNAGVQLINGQATASPAIEGRALNVPATVDRIRADAAGQLADGALDLVMSTTYPAIIDASPLVAQANVLLSSPFTVSAYDPIRDEWQHWSAPPDVWATWLTAESAPDNPTGLSLSMNTTGPAAFLQANATFADERFIKTEDAITAMQQAAARGQAGVSIRIWHDSTTYTVGAGQTLAAIAEEIGMPYPYIQAVNTNVNTDALMIGQVLAIPSKDVLVPLDPIPNKRIIISRSQQHLWAYANGQVVFDWVISTGLPSSPTALGTFQVQSHEINAYAEQWNLYMPHFMGFYHPGPNMDLMNGFHGFPTRGGGYLLWSGDLGHPVTYGCVLLSLENAEALYNWAEEGVVVEVRA